MILLVNGPNLNLLGEREPHIYGRETLADVERDVRAVCAAHGRELLAFQSNHEGALLDFLQAHRRAAEGVILNPGALTHTSRALPDCLRALPCPVVEVHVSNIHAREPWRRESHVSPASAGQIVGLGTAGYRFAATWLCQRLTAQEERADEGGAGTRAPAGGAAPGAGAAPQPSTPEMHVLAQSSPGRTPRPEPAAAPPPAGTPGLDLDEDAARPRADWLERGDYEPL